MNFSNLFPTSTQVRISRWCAEMCYVKDALESEQKNRKSDAWKLMNFTIFLPKCANFRADTSLNRTIRSSLLGSFCVGFCCQFQKTLSTGNRRWSGAGWTAGWTTVSLAGVCFTLYRRLFSGTSSPKQIWMAADAQKEEFQGWKKKIVVLHNFGRFCIINFILFFYFRKNLYYKEVNVSALIAQKGLSGFGNVP